MTEKVDCGYNRHVVIAVPCTILQDISIFSAMVRRIEVIILIGKNIFESVDCRAMTEKVDSKYNRDVVVIMPRTVSGNDAFFRAIDRVTLEVDHILRINVIVQGAGAI